jgi:di/tricarboxylate transporter
MLSFLTNLRDMKSSLSSGMILLFGIWVIFGNDLKDIQSDDSLAGNLLRLTEYLGPAGTLGVVAFVAYILGLVLSLDRAVLFYAVKIAGMSRGTGVVMSMTTRQRWDKFLNLAIARTLTKASLEFVNESIFRASSKQDDEGKNRDGETRLRLKLQRLMGEDMAILGVQLHSKREKAYEKYDKARTEAEFRAAIAIPLCLLGAIIGHRLIQEGQVTAGMIAFLLAVSTFTILVMKAQHKQQEANEEIINAIIVGDIEFAPLTTLKDIAEGTLKENDVPEPNTQIAVPRGPLLGWNRRES